jgi:polysaccharide biosynthesis protein PslG
VLAVATAILATAGTAAAAPPTPGVVTQAPLAERDFARMEHGGVQALRFQLRWPEVEPAEGAYDWSSLDPILAGAAAHGLEPLPFVYGSPGWVADAGHHPPLDSPADQRAWQSFLTALVQRYGRGGSFWQGRADSAPIKRWQIWNEPNFDFYWAPRPAPAEYARLVSLSADAIRAADPRADVVLAGVAPVASGMKWWRYLRQLYRAPGIKRDFDAVALHPYSPGISDLVTQMRLARRIMRAAGDGSTPLAVTELGWSSGHERAPLVVGPARQAKLLRSSFELLGSRRNWRVSDVDWYAWQDSTAVEAFCTFCLHAGLFDADGGPKPAWAAYRQAVQHSPSGP